jgi:hypothetical protein
MAHEPDSPSVTVLQLIDLLGQRPAAMESKEARQFSAGLFLPCPQRVTGLWWVCRVWWVVYREKTVCVDQQS